MKKFVCRLIKPALLIAVLVSFAAGCAGNEESSLTNMSTGTNHPEKLLENMEEVTSAQSVLEGKNLYAGVTVTQWSRLRLESIRKKGHALLKKHYPKKTVHFSTDYKVWLELKRFKEDIQKKHVHGKKRKKRLTNIEEHMKG
ncbi:hypothetical protein [Salibacterium halotolerans]|uniref:Sporulation lipoprotein YhcN/YlaJ (Spore_YhcN_YlaJ) n=1 Tax=Salibacterium halotolerans TaxID=1884432 RepID=A0A1I5NVC8_9BACI|nr:hypothetical protein [Salibacterium halotolerans]SFP25754.1 hypothetical protein SAMN05518683_103293 [Salibacterium halotolerans]